MQEPQTFNWLQYVPSTARPVDIKVEPSYLEPSFSLISPPSSPSFPRSAPTTSAILSCSTTSRRRSNTSLTSPKRVKPYSTSPRETRFRAEESGKMTNSPYGSWSPSSSKGRSNLSSERRSSDGDQQQLYALSSAYVPPHSFVGRSSNRLDHRPQSSSSSMTTSSLTGAMGDAQVSAHSRDSGSPPPRGDQSYSMSMHTNIDWASSQPSHHTSQSPIVPPHTNYHSASNPSNVQFQSLPPSASSSAPYLQYPDYNASMYHHNPSPESLSSPSPPFGAPASYGGEQFEFHQPRDHPSANRANSHYGSDTLTLASSSSSSSSSPGSNPREVFENEIRQLRKKVRELELINDSGRQRVRELEAELAKEVPYSQTTHSSSTGSSSYILGGLPSPLSTPSPQSATFQASWKARTDARIRQFCSLNRAGNALCAWHDSRRERRAYPPRMAPQGHLNCGCTYEEALFEESLARHGVGSYHPGETVRMDPALRNPLLKLLQSRYGYRDGDFERDAVTGDWVSGEGHVYWEQRAQSGANSRKIRNDNDRR